MIIGILQKATDAKEQTGIGQEKEIIALAYNSALAKKVSNGNSSAVTDSELNDELDSSEATASGSPIIVTFTKTRNAYEIDSNGVIKPSTPKDPNATLKVTEHKNEKFNTNTELEDSFGNKITVPAGFKITSDSPNNVTGGIIIEDIDAGTTATAGSQFVWIPVGDVYTDTNGTKTNIELCRCGFDESGEKTSVQNGYEYQLTLVRANMPNGMPDVAKDSQINYYRAFTFAEEETSREGSSTQNATAKNLRDFLSKASKGYYIGRYEARTTVQRTATGDATTIVTEKIEDPVYNYVTQLQASERSRNMYASENFESDLVNSYAWDTAILFLQEFDDRADKSIKYSLQTSLNNSVSQTGTTTDKICNIYDMASNCYEWTTETAINNTNPASIPCVERGIRI